MSELTDLQHMARAIQLARRGLFSTSPNPRVGCVLVRDGQVVGEGWHEKAGGPHAEVVALERAGSHARGADVYLTLEPCSHHGRTPPCSQALIEAGVARVVVAQRDPNPQVDGSGIGELESAGIIVETGLMTDLAEAINPGFNKRMRSGLPFVRSKLATSLDGRTAMASGESQWITGKAARRDVQRWRAQSCAIFSGSGTVIADNPSLNQRLEGEERQPLRVIVDSGLRVPVDAKCLNLDGPRLLVTTDDKIPLAGAYQDRGIEVLGLAPRPDGKVDLRQLMLELGKRQINEVLVEAGPLLNGALLAAKLVDELLVYQASHVMGNDARGMFTLAGLVKMNQRIKLERKDMRLVGDDLRMLFAISEQD
ncbi:MAG: bifunctional diaminohydroxyphosphoribosylaminopyrimidine deaminase/5-amino-6-(5-phosphoribosylamino)uracil reductase RibD [Gammaproteobacteria bacterium]|nr:bifunctional diaminohydroxyphosphoribosylaminopyrimidine deaminase/5-amino-6-(5-phosphoribosylamino)uracil reductase RibD [Gammaproteobacteria bacterium]